MKANRENRGQFIVIAIMLMAIMIVSIGALMNTAITYYKHEPWEEYSALVGDIEINSRKIAELSLAGYSNSVKDDTILATNLIQWQNDLAKIYPGRGIVLSSSGYSMTGQSSSNPQASATLTLTINSIGLKGYKFLVNPSLSLDVDILSSGAYNLSATVRSESGEPVAGLDASNFKINGASPTLVSPYYETDTLVYKIVYHGTSPMTVEVWDQRGIRAVV